MRRGLIFLAAIIASVGFFGLQTSAAVTYKDVLQEEWNLFKVKFNKTFSDTDPAEEQYRFKVFLDNKHKIAKHNRRHASGEVSYSLALNKFADMTNREFVSVMNGYKAHLRQKDPKSDNHPLLWHELRKLDSNDVEVPKSVDWRQHGYVTSVKDQGHCGSCWAFSSTGALEGQNFAKTGNLISLSEQNLVDCSRKYGNMGCDGGLMENAFRYIRDNHGVDTENSYHYEAHDAKCRFNNKTVGADDKGFVAIPSGDEKKLTKALAMKGPVSVAIDASQDSFRFYDGGVYNEPACGNSEENLDHGVLVVGYGTDPVHGDYYLVKNSWSETWGQYGYIKMARNKENQCGIATSACYPIV